MTELIFLLNSMLLRIIQAAVMWVAFFINVPIHAMHVSVTFGAWKQVSKTKSVGQFDFLNLNFYLLQNQHKKNLKQSQFFKIICFETSLSYHHLTYRPCFDAAWTDLCIVHIPAQTGNQEKNVPLTHGQML